MTNFYMRLPDREEGTIQVAFDYIRRHHPNAFSGILSVSPKEAIEYLKAWEVPSLRWTDTYSFVGWGGNKFSTEKEIEFHTKSYIIGVL